MKILRVLELEDRTQEMEFTVRIRMEVLSVPSKYVLRSGWPSKPFSQGVHRNLGHGTADHKIYKHQPSRNYGSHEAYHRMA